MMTRRKLQELWSSLSFWWDILRLRSLQFIRQGACLFYSILPVSRWSLAGGGVFHDFCGATGWNAGLWWRSVSMDGAQEVIIHQRIYGAKTNPNFSFKFFHLPELNDQSIKAMVARWDEQT